MKKSSLKKMYINERRRCVGCGARFDVIDIDGRLHLELTSRRQRKWLLDGYACPLCGQTLICYEPVEDVEIDQREGKVLRAQMGYESA